MNIVNKNVNRSSLYKVYTKLKVQQHGHATCFSGIVP